MREESQQGTQSACPHPEAVGIRWSDSISADGQAALQTRLDAWEAPSADHGDRKRPSDATGLSDDERKRLRLSAAGVRWLADRVRNEYGQVPDLHLETLYVNTSRYGGQGTVRAVSQLLRHGAR